MVGIAVTQAAFEAFAAMLPLKDFRRIATRYDKLARNFFSALCLVATLVYWLDD